MARGPLPRPPILMIYMEICKHWAQSRVANIFFPPQKFLVAQVPEIPFSFPNVPFFSRFPLCNRGVGALGRILL